ncbi:DM13 domain-containing protein [Variovorax sp. RT4R15]|uniref:DM13 domain-containing protein n=1 Tax=Variovorax sp. RT4R15 TaxID=3443737 RepID=UPI003F487B2E
MKKAVLLAISHLLVLALGFAGGIYVLPILIAPPAPSMAELGAAASGATFKGRFQRDLKGSDMLHWGEGEVSVGPRAITLQGKLAPGPDYKLYLSPEFVETEADFLRLKSTMQRVGDVKTFDGFVVPVPEGVDVARYKAAIVWCETFSQFISATQYRP